jgi:hypothetical protein
MTTEHLHEEAPCLTDLVVMGKIGADYWNRARTQSNQILNTAWLRDARVGKGIKVGHGRRQV